MRQGLLDGNERVKFSLTRHLLDAGHFALRTPRRRNKQLHPGVPQQAGNSAMNYDAAGEVVAAMSPWTEPIDE
jgi:hypothetical protein